MQSSADILAGTVTVTLSKLEAIAMVSHLREAANVYRIDEFYSLAQEASNFADNLSAHYDELSKEGTTRPDNVTPIFGGNDNGSES